MRKAPIWTPEEDATIIAGRAAGDTHQVIAQSLPGRTRQAVRWRAWKLLDAGKIERREGGLKSPWTPEKDAELARLWDLGLSGAEIGKEMGFSKHSIIGRAHRLELPAREDPIRSKPPSAESIHWPHVYCAKHVDTCVVEKRSVEEVEEVAA